MGPMWHFDFLDDFFERHPLVTWMLSALTILAVPVMDWSRIRHDALTHGLAGAVWAAIAVAAVLATVTLPLLALALRPSLGAPTGSTEGSRTSPRKEDRGTARILVAGAVLVMVPWGLTHSRFGWPDPTLSDPLSVGMVVYPDVLMVWALVAGTWLVRRRRRRVPG